MKCTCQNFWTGTHQSLPLIGHDLHWHPRRLLRPAFPRRLRPGHQLRNHLVGSFWNDLVGSSQYPWLHPLGIWESGLAPLHLVLPAPVLKLHEKKQTVYIFVPVNHICVPLFIAVHIESFGKSQRMFIQSQETVFLLTMESTLKISLHC